MIASRNPCQAPTRGRPGWVWGVGWLLLSVLAVAMAASASAATLRSATTLHSQTVYLHDLFDDAGSNADRPLGPGPAAGGRLWLESPQLGAIARQFGVDWRPASRADRLLLEFPGKPLRREDMIDALREALIAAGASAECAIEVPGFNPPIVPLDVAVRPEIGQLDFESASGRFTASLTLVGDGLTPIMQRVSGRVDDVVDLPVPVKRLAAGAVLQPDDLHIMRVRTALVHAEVVREMRQAVGMQVRRQVAAGVPLAISDLTRPMTVPRGGSVLMRIAAGGLAVTAPGIALEGGATGERIRVQNIVSRAVVEAEVIAPGEVRVAPTVAGARQNQ